MTNPDIIFHKIHETSHTLGIKCGHRFEVRTHKQQMCWQMTRWVNDAALQKSDG